MLGKYNLGKDGDILSAAPLAILQECVPAKDRIIKPYELHDRWCDKRGFYVVLVNTETKKEWDVGTKYDYEGYVNDLNKDILTNKFK